MASLVHQTAPAMSCSDDEFMPQSFGCFGRSLSRASSSRRLEYRTLSGAGEAADETRRVAQERSARAKLRWKAVAQEIIMARRRGGGGASGARRRKAAGQTAFSYDSKSYALNFDQGAAE
uniref:Uncharacterized protein n=1 Tax=Avena sativa TaxID=4498 RepID=A0ACD5YX51_AVESA